MFFFFSSRRRHTRFDCDWSSDVCSSDLAVQEDVLRLDVAVHQAVLVGESKPARSLKRELERVAYREPPLPHDQLLQVLAVDVLEDDVLPTLVLPAVDHRNDVRV